MRADPSGGRITACGRVSYGQRIRPRNSLDHYSGLVIRSAMTGNARHAGILEAYLLTVEVELLAEAVELAGAVGPASMTLDNLGTCCGQCQVRQRDDVEDSGADTRIPLPGETQDGVGRPPIRATSWSAMLISNR